MMIFRCVAEEEGGSAVLRGDTLAVVLGPSQEFGFLVE